MGTRNIILTMGVILMVTAVLRGSLFRTKKAVAIFVVAAGLALWGTYGLAYKLNLRRTVLLL